MAAILRAGPLLRRGAIPLAQGSTLPAACGSLLSGQAISELPTLCLGKLAVSLEFILLCVCSSRSGQVYPIRLESMPVSISWELGPAWPVCIYLCPHFTRVLWNDLSLQRRLKTEGPLGKNGSLECAHLHTASLGIN